MKFDRDYKWIERKNGYYLFGNAYNIFGRISLGQRLGYLYLNKKGLFIFEPLSGEILEDTLLEVNKQIVELKKLRKGDLK